MRLPLLTVTALALLVPSALAEAPTPAQGTSEAQPAVVEGVPGSADAPAEAPAEGEGQVEDEAALLAAFEAQLSYREGDIVVGDNLATLRLGQAFRFLGPEDAERVLVAWGNPPGSGALGMIFPQGTGATTKDGWAVVVSYAEEGHVKDEDAKDLDFDELLEDMKKDTEESNEERQKAGYDPVHLVGWAEPPHYDSSSKKLYWAKELDFGAEEHTLNYDIRVLGRKGVLELSAVASIQQLALVKAEMPKVLEAVEFNQGMRYADFNPDIDTVAAYGVGALVAGKVAAKAGFFKVLLSALVAGKKFLIVGVVGLAALLKKLLTGKREDPSSPPTTEG